jgi:hypothetical protein
MGRLEYKGVDIQLLVAGRPIHHGIDRNSFLNIRYVEVFHSSSHVSQATYVFLRYRVNLEEEIHILNDGR